MKRMKKYWTAAAFILTLGLIQMVAAQPQIRLDPEQLEIEAMWYPGEMMGHWEYDHDPLYVINDGDATLRVTGFEADVEWLYASPDEFELEPEGRRRIRFDISDYWGFDEYDVTFTISSNDPDNEEVELPVHAILETFPLDVWPPFPFEADLYQGQVEQFEIILHNIGDEPIRFRIEYEIIAQPDQDDPPPWLEFEPEEGVIEPDEEVTITITANMDNCAPGDYEADIIISTDNPAVREIVYNILIHVTAAPDIDVVWLEEHGYPDVVDWNQGLRLFMGFPYDMVVEVFNRGSALLVIDDIYCENEYFTAEPFDLELGPDESAEVIFIFNADEAGEYNETMIFVWNDPNMEDYEVALHAEAFLPPIIRVEPEEGFEEDMFTGEVVENELIISNEGDATLRFCIEREIIAEPWDERDKAIRDLRIVGAVSGPTRDRRSDPDDMGYEWRDNLEDDGPVFEWIDFIEFDQTREFRLGDNENTGEINLGWSFPFWDREFDRIFVDSDGWLSFSYGGNDIGISASEFPYAADDDSRGANTISFFNDDNQDGTDIWVWTNEEDMTVIEWHGDHRFYFQLILFGDGLVVMQYGQDIDQNTGEVGVNLGDGEHGWFISERDNRYIVPGRAIGFGPQEAWISWIAVHPVEGEVEPDEELIVTVFLNAYGCVGGDYEAELIIYNNDPANSEVVVPVIMHICVPPCVPVTWPEEWGCPDVLDFNLARDDIFCDVRYELPIEFYNGSFNDMVIDGIESNNDCFHAYPTEFVLEPDEEREVFIVFEAEEDGEYEGTITIFTNDPDEGEIVINVRAESEELRLYHYTGFTETDLSHRLNITEVTFENGPVPTGWEIGVFTEDDILAGAGVWEADEELDMQVYGDDPDTDEDEGFENGEQFTFRLWDHQQRREYFAIAVFDEGPELWVNNGESVIAITGYDSPPGFPFSQGWNLISLNIVPIDEYWDPDDDRGPDMRLMAEEFIVDDEQQLIIIKDEHGDILFPYYHYWGIDFWNLNEGYYVKVLDDLDVPWMGLPIPSQTEIPIEEGWNMIAYFPDYELPACRESDFYAFSSIIDHVHIVKNRFGEFILPEWNFSNMRPCAPGMGFQICVDEDLVLVYPEEFEEFASERRVPERPNHFTTPAPTGSNMSLLVTGVESDSKVTELGVFTSNGLCVGSAVFDGDNSCGISVWGDDPTTDIIDGAADGDMLTIRMWDGSVERALTQVWLEGDGMYRADCLMVAALEYIPAAVAEFELHDAYPNPFNSMVCLSYALPRNGPVRLAAYDIMGREIEVIANGYRQAGHHRVEVDASSWASGVYVARLRAGSTIRTTKLVCVK